MSDPAANPLILALLFIARCLVPIGVLLGLSYLLRRLGLVRDTSTPTDQADESNGRNESLLHGRP